MEAQPGDSRLFKGQFVLSRDGRAAPEGWQADGLRGWTLQHCPSLPVSTLVDGDSERIGWLLGYPVAGSGRLIRDRLGIALPAAQARFPEALEKAIGDLAGRFAAIVVTPDVQRLYMDPAAQLAVVYSPTEGVAASSLCLARTRAMPETDLVELLGVPDRDRYFPFGLTPDKAFRRVLPNHFLDLSSFSLKRHWPTGDGFGHDRTAETRPAVQAIADKLKSNIGALAAEYPLLMSITAGRDSRVLLAATREHKADIAFFTTAIPDQAARLDCRSARDLASRHALRHRVLEWADATEQELREWQVRVGHCVAGRTWRSVRTLSQTDPSRLFLPGLCAEVGRAYYWRREDFRDRPVSAQEVVVRLGLPPARRLLYEADAWLSGLPVSNRLDILDLLYVEQRLGAWAGPSHYGHVHNVRVVPLSDRRIFSLMLGLPHRYRFRQRLAPDLIDLLWPELRRLPFNRDPGVRAAAGVYGKRVRSAIGRRLGIPSGLSFR